MERFGRFHFSLFTFHSSFFTFHFSLLFLYQALQRPQQFVTHADDVALDTEALVDLRHGLEVRSKVAVVASGDCDVLALEDVRITLAGRVGKGLNKGEVFLVVIFLTDLVAPEHAWIVLTVLNDAVAAQDSFQIYAKMRVAVPTLKHF